MSLSTNSLLVELAGSDGVGLDKLSVDMNVIT